MKAMNPAARWTLVASVIAGVSYVATWGVELPQPIEIAWKGAGVALLAIHAAVRARSLDGWLLVCVMSLGALGDVLLEIAGLTTGAVAFLLGHVVASGLYLRHRRIAWPAALVLAPAVAGAAWLLPTARPPRGSPSTPPSWASWRRLRWAAACLWRLWAGAH